MPAWVAAGGAVLGGLLGSKGASKAAGAQAAAAQAAAAEEKRQFDITRADFAPYRQVGKEGLMSLAQLLGLPSGMNAGLASGVSATAPNRNNFYTNVQTGTTKTGRYFDPYIGWKGQTQTPVMERRFDEGGYNNALVSYEAARKAQADAVNDPEFGSLLRGYQFEEDPGYQFGRDQGELALQRGASATGMRFSPATQKALLRFNQDYAGTKYNEGFNRDQITKNQTFNMLSGIAGAGQNASATTAQLGAQTAGNVGNYLTQAGNASAAGSVGQANALVGSMNNGLNMWSQQRMLDQYLAGGNNVAGDAYQPSRQYYGR